MKRSAPAAFICTLPFVALAQSVAAQDMICLSVGGPDTWTQVAIYGADDTALVMAIPPAGDDDAVMESLAVSLRLGAFNDMIVALLPLLLALPDAPAPDTCAEDALGPVAIAVTQPGAEPLRYDATCTSEALLALTDDVIRTTGDPLGAPLRDWSGPVVPAMRDICRSLP